MTTAVELTRDPARVAWVVADSGSDVSDVLAQLDAIGFVALRTSRSALAAVRSPPGVALVVGSGAQAHAQVREACAALRADPVLRGVPIVVALPAARIPISDPELDAHEFIVTPLRPGELRSRIDRATAAAPVGPHPDPSVRVGTLRLHPCRGAASIGEEPLRLTAREFALLYFLVRNAGEVHSRTRLRAAVWSREAGVQLRAVDVLVRRIRAKLGDERGRCVRTVRNVGYAFDLFAARAILSD